MNSLFFMSSAIENEGAPASSQSGESATAPPTTPCTGVAPCRHIAPDDVVENSGWRTFIGSPPHHRMSISNDVVPELPPAPTDKQHCLSFK
jgi:hypothetical protein